MQNILRQTGQGHFDDNHVSVKFWSCLDANLNLKNIILENDNLKTKRAHKGKHLIYHFPIQSTHQRGLHLQDTHLGSGAPRIGSLELISLQCLVNFTFASDVIHPIHISISLKKDTKKMIPNTKKWTKYIPYSE